MNDYQQLFQTFPQREPRGVGLRRYFALGAVCMACALAPAALAQDSIGVDPVPASLVETDSRNAGRGEDVMDRFRDELPPPGARIGAFILQPRIGARVAYDDNIYATSSNEDEDLITTLSGGLRLDSDLPRHDIGVRASADVNRYLDNVSENNWTGELGTGGAFDINPDTKLGADLSVRRLVEARDDPDDLGADTPTAFKAYRGLTYLENTSGALFSRVEAGVNRLEYEDVTTGGGTTIPASERNRDEPFVGGYFGYRYLGAQQVYLRGQANERDYETAVDSGGFRRESTGYRAEVGATADLGGLVFVDAAVGYQEQSYDDDRFGTPSSPIGSLKILWNPSRVTSVRAESSYEFAESFNVASPGYWRSETSLRVAHEIHYDFLATARLVYLERDFERLARNDEVYGWDLGVSYRIDRGLFLDAEYRYRESESSTAAGYERNLVFLQIRRTF